MITNGGESKMLSKFELEGRGQMACVIIRAHDEGLTVRAEIAWATIDDAIGRTNLTKEQRAQIVDDNIDLFGGIAAEKYARREFTKQQLRGTTYAHIDISTGDVEPSRARMVTPSLE
jgi:hypothetical protein